MKIRTSCSRLPRAAAVAACAAAVLTAAACSSSSGSSSAAAPTGSSSASTSVSSAAQALLTQRLAEPSGWQNPGTAISDLAKAKGAKVLYIPISLKIPYFQQVYAAMQQAAGHAGITVSACDGNFSPTDIAACVNQAIAQHVSQVVLDNIPLGLIGAGATAMEGAGIKVLDAEVGTQAGTDKVAYLDAGGPEMISAMADWIAVDSKGKGDVLIVEQDDTPLQAQYITGSLLPRFKQVCPGCKTTVITTTSPQLGNLGSAVDTALLKDPSIGYVASEFDANATYIVSGLKNSDRSNVKLVGAIGDLAALERVKSGQQAEDTVLSPGFAGWAIIDDVLRMQTGNAPVDNANAPFRMFDSSNIGSASVTMGAFTDDSLWGGDFYTKSYLKLWGAS
jgi:ribose transport system substrate-binding protein